MVALGCTCSYLIILHQHGRTRLRCHSRYSKQLYTADLVDLALGSVVDPFCRDVLKGIDHRLDTSGHSIVKRLLLN